MAIREITDVYDCTKRSVPSLTYYIRESYLFWLQIETGLIQIFSEWVTYVVYMRILEGPGMVIVELTVLGRGAFGLAIHYCLD